MKKFKPIPPDPYRLVIHNAYWCVVQCTNCWTWKPFFSWYGFGSGAIDWGVWVLAVSFKGEMEGKRK